MKRLMVVALFGLGFAAAVVPAQAGGLPEAPRMVHRIGRFHLTHAMRLKHNEAPQPVHRIGVYEKTHSMRPGTR